MYTTHFLNNEALIPVLHTQAQMHVYYTHMYACMHVMHIIIQTDTPAQYCVYT